MTRYRLTTRRKEQLIHIAFVVAVIAIIIPSAIGAYTLFDTSPPTDETVIKFYELRYKDGVLIRSGRIGDFVGWDIYENGERVFDRVADNELKLRLGDFGDLFQKGHTYTAHLTDLTYPNSSIQVSNSVTFTY